MKLRMNVDTKASPGQVLAALTDFSEARPDIWPALDRGRYEVHEVGDTWADVTEASSSPNVWAREHYDWSADGVVAWHVTESNFCKPGSSVTVRITERPDGGSDLEIEWDRTPSSLRWSLMFVGLRVMLPRMIPKYIRSVLDDVASTS